MDSTKFTEYNIADLSNNIVTDILELEKSLSQKANKEIILIAYQPKTEAK